MDPPFLLLLPEKSERIPLFDNLPGYAPNMWIRTIIGFFFAFHSCNCENFTNPSSVSIDLLNRPYLTFDENTNTNTCRKSEREKEKNQNRFKWIRHISSMHNGRQGSLVDEIT